MWVERAGRYNSLKLKVESLKMPLYTLGLELWAVVSGL